LDAEDYFNGGWESNLYQSDEALGTFSTYCHQAGSDNCSFWGPTPQNITDRLDNILSTLQNHPVPVSGLKAGSEPGLATYADLKQLLLWGVYAPVQRFPLLADALVALEGGDGSQVMSGLEDVVVADDVDTIVKCVDGYRGTDLSTLDAYRSYIRLLENESHYFGDAWPTNADNVLCRSLNLTTSTTRSFSGFSHPTTYNTSFPILYVASTIDPVTPTSRNPPRGAYKMSQYFPGSVILLQDSVGHTASVSASDCLAENIGLYFSGILPKANTTCHGAPIPFQDT